MRKQMMIVAALFAVIWSASLEGHGAERSFSWTHAPNKSDRIPVNLNPFALGKYLAECQVNRPEIVREVKELLERGEHYRKRTPDQKGTRTLLTIYVDNDYMLHITTHRNETCPTCGGTGKRAAPFDNATKHVSVQFACLACDGKGSIPNHTVQRYFKLSSEDFENPEEGRQIFQERAFAFAVPGAEQWVERLASANPQERFEACLWLDQNYVHVGTFFQDIMPMLKKARFYDANDKRKVMVWQFWAGKDIPQESRRAYYRIYVDQKTGKVTQKGFFAGR